jgi:hypothetical protein
VVLHKLDTDFKIVGDCLARPGGWRRVLIDLVCRWIGHQLWRNMHSEHRPANGSLPLHGSHCRRCFRFGYVEGDYRL